MNHTVQVIISGSTYNLKYGLKALFFYEELEGKPFEYTKMEDSYKLLHASLLAYNSNYSMTFDSLLDACDEDPAIFESFVKLTEESARRTEQIKKKEGGEGKAVSVIALYEEIVARGGVSPDYFFNEMDIYECVVYLNGMRRKERAELERTRLIMWAALTPYSKKELELDDVLKLEHLQEDTETNHINAAEELRGLRERAKRMEEIMNE